MLLVLLALAGKNATTPVRRSCRRFARNRGWWRVVWLTYSSRRFKQTFRVSRDTFTYILDRIKHVLERKTVVEEPVPPENLYDWLFASIVLAGVHTITPSGVARLFKLGGHFIRWKIVGGAREKTSDKKTVPHYNTRSATVR